MQKINTEKRFSSKVNRIFDEGKAKDQILSEIKKSEINGGDISIEDAYLKSVKKIEDKIKNKKSSYAV